MSAERQVSLKSNPEAGAEADRLKGVRARTTEKALEAMGESDKIVQVGRWDKRKFFVPESVFPPSVEGQRFSKGVMAAHSEYAESVLDVGTGCGILAVEAGMMGADIVTATDLNPKAITAVKVNWQLNGLDPDRLDAVEADSLKGLAADASYTLIVANPPVQPFLETDIEDFANRSTWEGWNEGGSKGNEVLLDLLGEGVKRLKPGGVLLTTTSSRHGHRTTTELLDGMDDQIASWGTVEERELPLAPQYFPYIPIWESHQENDGDERIWKGDEGKYYHKFMVLKVVKNHVSEPDFS